jgi:spore germination protein PA
MAALIGGVKVITVESGGQFHVGDSALIAPKNTPKATAGSGAFNSGDFPRTFNLFSTTNTNDPDLADSNCVTVL